MIFLFFELNFPYHLDLKENKINQYALYYKLNTELENIVFANWNKRFTSRTACWIAFNLIISFFWTFAYTYSFKLYNFMKYWVILIWEIDDGMVFSFFLTTQITISVIGKT